MFYLHITMTTYFRNKFPFQIHNLSSFAVEPFCSPIVACSFSTTNILIAEQRDIKQNQFAFPATWVNLLQTKLVFKWFFGECGHLVCQIAGHTQRHNKDLETVTTHYWTFDCVWADITSTYRILSSEDSFCGFQ